MNVRANTRTEPTPKAAPPSPPKRRARFPRRAFAIALTVAALLHLPFLPTQIGAWLERALGLGFQDYDEADAQAIIPIDLDLEESSPTADGVVAPQPEKSPEGAQGKATPPPKSEPAAVGEGTTIVDAGAPVDLDASAPPRPKKHREPSDGGDSDAEAPDAAPPPKPGLRDPVAAAGGVGKISAKDPNVQVLLSGRVLRKFELGATLSRILGLIPEWKQFLDGTPIDPIRDLDNMLITAPRFRGDSSKMVVVMGFNLPEARIHDAVDLVVQRSHGAWLEDTPIPAAQAKVLGGDRIFALVPKHKLLVVLPAEAKEQLGGLKNAKGFRSSTVGAVISMVTPARPFHGLFPLPESLKWLRLAATPTEDGGADLTIETGDGSAAEAATHAPEIAKGLDAVRTIDVFGLKMDVVDHIDLAAEGDVIKGKVHVSRRQLGLIMSFAEGRLRDLNGGGAAGGMPAPALAPTPAPKPTGSAAAH